MAQHIGLDKSRYQGDPTEEQVALQLEANVKYIVARTGQGAGYQDQTFPKNAAIYRNKMEFTGYHFTTNDSPQAQCNNIFGVIESVGGEVLTLPPALDCEGYTSYSGTDYLLRDLKIVLNTPLLYSQNLDASGMRPATGRILRFASNRRESIFQLVVAAVLGLTYPSEAVIDAIGRKLTTWMLSQPQLVERNYLYPMIYTNYSSGAHIFKTASMKRYYLWVANWGVTTPLKPPVWKDEPYMIWQDGVVSGLPYGISGQVDHNLWGYLFPFPGGSSTSASPSPSVPPSNYVGKVTVALNGGKVYVVEFTEDDRK